MRPATGATVPRRARSMVVFPDPDGPTMPVKAPGRTSRSASTSTGSPSYAQVTPSRRSSGSLIGPPPSMVPRWVLAGTGLLGRSLGVHRPVGGAGGRDGLEGGGVAAQALDHGHEVELHQAQPGVVGVAGAAREVVVTQGVYVADPGFGADLGQDRAGKDLRAEDGGYAL